jgi:hypothetical protein
MLFVFICVNWCQILFPCLPVVKYKFNIETEVHNFFNNDRKWKYESLFIYIRLIILEECAHLSSYVLIYYRMLLRLITSVSLSEQELLSLWKTWVSTRFIVGFVIILLVCVFSSEMYVCTVVFVSHFCAVKYKFNIETEVHNFFNKYYYNK